MDDSISSEARITLVIPIRMISSDSRYSLVCGSMHPMQDELSRISQRIGVSHSPEGLPISPTHSVDEQIITISPSHIQMDTIMLVSRISLMASSIEPESRSSRHRLQVMMVSQ
jgi:hypothetical protein